MKFFSFISQFRKKKTFFKQCNSSHLLQSDSTKHVSYRFVSFRSVRIIHKYIIFLFSRCLFFILSFIFVIEIKKREYTVNLLFGTEHSRFEMFRFIYFSGTKKNLWYETVHIIPWLVVWWTWLCILMWIQNAKCIWDAPSQRNWIQY